MSTLIWAQELQLATKKAESVGQKLTEEKDSDAQETRGKMMEIVSKLQKITRDVWNGDDNPFEVV